MYDLYECNEDDSVRFVLGKAGNKKLIVIGLNPNTANKKKSDTTATKVEKVAYSNRFDGFLMINLYPQRGTDPKGLTDRASNPGGMLASWQASVSYCTRIQMIEICKSFFKKYFI